MLDSTSVNALTLVDAPAVNASVIAQVLATLDRFDLERQEAKDNKNQRAIDTLILVQTAIEIWRSDNNVGIIRLLLARSEFSGMMRLMLPHIVTNCYVEGQGAKLRIKFTGNANAAIWNEAGLTVFRAFHNLNLRIDSDEVKAVYKPVVTDIDVLLADKMEPVLALAQAKIGKSGKKAWDCWSQAQRDAFIAFKATFA